LKSPGSSVCVIWVIALVLIVLGNLDIWLDSWLGGIVESCQRY